MLKMPNARTNLEVEKVEVFKKTKLLLYQKLVTIRQSIDNSKAVIDNAILSHQTIGADMSSLNRASLPNYPVNQPVKVQKAVSLLSTVESIESDLQTVSNYEFLDIS